MLTKDTEYYDLSVHANQRYIILGSESASSPKIQKRKVSIFSSLRDQELAKKDQKFGFSYKAVLIMCNQH